MQWHRCGLIASWEFLEEHIERKNGSEGQLLDKPLVEKHCERKWGAMVIIKSLQFLPSIISASLRETTHNPHEEIPNGSIELTNWGNMMHIALVGINNQMSLLQDRYALSFPCQGLGNTMHIPLVTVYYATCGNMHFT